MDVDSEIGQFIAQLPLLCQEDFDPEDTCPICLNPLLDYCQSGSPGVTRLPGCSHMFCKGDLITWIESKHGSCPTCRNPFLDIIIPSESDDESSDGGEYLPNEDDDEMTDAFTSEMDDQDWDSHSDWNDDSLIQSDSLGEEGEVDWEAVRDFEQHIDFGPEDGPSSDMSSDMTHVDDTPSSDNDPTDAK